MATPKEKENFKTFYNYMHEVYSNKELDDLYGYHDLESYKSELLKDRKAFEKSLKHFDRYKYDMPPDAPELFVMHELIPRIEHDGGSDLEQAIYNSYLAHKWWNKYDNKYRKMPSSVKVWYKNALTSYFETLFPFFEEYEIK